MTFSLDLQVSETLIPIHDILSLPLFSINDFIAMYNYLCVILQITLHIK